MPTYTLVPIHLGRINLDLGIMTYRMSQTPPAERVA